MVRNFWIEAEIDGRKTTLSGGPQRKDGGMEICLTQRDNGKIVEALKIECWADGDKLVTRFYFGEEEYRFETER